jgi:hypothetical protein
MPTGRWNHDTLDAMRQLGDAPADALVSHVYEDENLERVQVLLSTLGRNDDIPEEGISPDIRSFFDVVPYVPEPATVVEGQRLFADYGPEMLMVLACCSLPAAYAAEKGVKVLCGTNYLKEKARRRLFETAQMVVDVMSPGGLGPRGRGRITARKVRLMHAGVRQLLLRQQWRTDELGVPINQEDLAGTLMTFSVLVLDGLRKLEINVPNDRAEAYLQTWCAVGRMMGIVDEMIPADLNEARELMALIQERQIRASDHGRELTFALLEMLEAQMLPGFKGVPAALMRTFLPVEVADSLGVYAPPVWDQGVKTGITVGHALEAMTEPVFPRRTLRPVGMRLLQFLISAHLLGSRPQFAIPRGLHDSWLSSRG